MKCLVIMAIIALAPSAFSQLKMSVPTPMLSSPESLKVDTSLRIIDSVNVDSTFRHGKIIFAMNMGLGKYYNSAFDWRKNKLNNMWNSTISKQYNLKDKFQISPRSVSELYQKSIDLKNPYNQMDPFGHYNPSGRK